MNKYVQQTFCIKQAIAATQVKESMVDMWHNTTNTVTCWFYGCEECGSPNVSRETKEGRYG